MPADASDAASGDSRARFGFDLPVRNPRDSTVEPASTRAAFGQKSRAEDMDEFLESLSHSPVVSAIPNRQVGRIKSLETIAHDNGAAVETLENHIRNEMSAFVERAVSTRRVYTLEHQVLIDKLYHLYILGGQPGAPAWLSAIRHFETFVDRFCPQADLFAKRGLIDCVEAFVRFSLLPSQLYRPDIPLNVGDTTLPAYDDPGNWIRLDGAWVNTEVIDEARQCVSEGFSDAANLLAHDTGSPALSNIAKHKAIWSAQLSLQHGEELVTGEYAFSAYQQSHTSLKGTRGHNNVYTSRGSLSSKNYTIQRWFDESPVTFGISEKRQRTYDRARGVDGMYLDRGTEIGIGPVVPLENIVAIAAPKQNEDMFRAWIEAHCPMVRFVSYEALTLLEYADKRVREPPAPKSSRGGFDRDFLA